MLEAVPDEPEPDEDAAAVVHALALERHDEPDLAAELMEQVERWQRLADELREERDAVQHHLAARDRSLAAAYAQIEEAAERLAASERARTEAEETAAELGEMRHLLEVERGHREQVEDAADALRAELEASESRCGWPARSSRRPGASRSRSSRPSTSSSSAPARATRSSRPTARRPSRGRGSSSTSATTSC